jgi:hypothetical protein
MRGVIISRYVVPGVARTEVDSRRATTYKSHSCVSPVLYGWKLSRCTADSMQSQFPLSFELECSGSLTSIFDAG